MGSSVLAEPEKAPPQRILIRLLRQYEGHVAVLGREMRAWNSDYLERIGVTFELPNHYLKLITSSG